MNINHKFTKKELALLLNICPIIFIVVVLSMIMSMGVGVNFNVALVNALWIFIVPPFSVLFIIFIFIYLKILTDFFKGVHKNVEYTKINLLDKVIRKLEFINIIILIASVIYVFFVALLQYETYAEKIQIKIDGS